MAQMNMAVNAASNGSPTQVGTRTITKLNRTNHVFSSNDFTDTTPPYVDPEGDALFSVKILTLPATGTLELDGVAVTANDEITRPDLDSGLLVFIPASQDAEFTTSFTFDVADQGSQSFSGLTGTVNITVQQYVNLPPSAVGDNTISNIVYNSEVVFTTANFTTGTTPAYADPEGDSADKLKVLTLPTQGQLRLSGSPVVVNQIIDFTDINAGNFTFKASGLNTGYSVNFQFAIADAGSNQFTS